MLSEARVVCEANHGASAFFMLVGWFTTCECLTSIYIIMSHIQYVVPRC